MSQLKPIVSHLDPIIPSSTGKFKSPPYAFHPSFTLWSFLLFFCSPPAGKRPKFGQGRRSHRLRGQPRGDGGGGVVGLDNFNSYYESGLKKARKSLLERQGVFIIDGDIDDGALLAKLFEIIHFSHVMHLAAHPQQHQGLRQLARSLQERKPSAQHRLGFLQLRSPSRRRTGPISTKKAGDEIAHTYNHIYGLSITGLRFFTVYGGGPTWPTTSSPRTY